MGGPTRVAVVHRNRLFRDCLVSTLAEEGFDAFSLEHDASLAGVADPLDALAAGPPAVVLLGLSLPGGMSLALARQIRARLPQVRVMLLTSRASEEDLYECLRLDVEGCFLEEAALADLHRAVRIVARGERYFSPELAFSVFRELAGGPRSGRWWDSIESMELTPRELEILGLVAERLSNKAIAERLSLSLYTVKNHVHNIVEKLPVTDRHEAVEYALRRRWLKPPSAANHLP